VANIVVVEEANVHIRCNAQVWQNCGSKARDVLEQLFFSQRYTMQTMLRRALANRKDRSLFVDIASAVISEEHGRDMAQAVWGLVSFLLVQMIFTLCLDRRQGV